MDKLRGRDRVQSKAKGGRGRPTRPAPEPTPEPTPTPEPRPEPDGVWTIGPIINGRNYSVGMPETTTGDFDFPRCSDPVSPQGPSVHYLTQPHSAPLAGSMTLEFEIVGTGELTATEGTVSERLRLFFQRDGDDWMARNGTENYRWWSTAYADLTPGLHIVTAPLEHGLWTQVTGQTGTAARFAAALNDPDKVGFSFGGQFAGHGVCALTGQARFVLKRLHIG